MTLLNVGRGSGVWFVKSVNHHWQVSSGFVTHAQLVRGDNEKAQGGGKCNAPRPMVIHSEIYNQERTVYCGPRKTDAENQATFTYGDGQNLISFHVTENGAKNKKGAGTDTKGKLRDKKETARSGSGIDRQQNRNTSTPSGDQKGGAGSGSSR